MNQVIKSTEKYLSGFIPYINENITKSNKRWALVGGFVRDSLISSLLGVKINSPDIDIAVAGKIPNLKRTSELIEISKNSFGGLKLETDKFGLIDVWSLEEFGILSESYIEWEGYLNQIDFSINAIIYTYPEQKLYIHEDWFNSFNNRLISQLYKLSPSPDLQLIRAIALAKNLSIKTGYHFKTNEKILDQLYELINFNNNEVYIKLIDYTVDKIIKDRWPFNVLSEIIDVKIARELV